MERFRKTICILCVFTMVFSYAACGKKKATPTTTQATQIVEDNIQDIQNNEVVVTDSTTTTQASNYTPQATQPVQTQPAPTQTPVQQGQQPQPTDAPTEAPTQAPVQNSGSVETIIYDDVTPRQTVYCPPNMRGSNQSYPVLVWANGTMVKADFYASLLVELSNMGYIVIANDESMSADGSAQLYSLDFLLNESNNSASPLYGKVDSNKIALIGHSQGGRSSVNAAAKDNRVKCVISIAGSNFDYEAELNSKPTLFFAGSKDMIVNPEQWLVTAFDAVKGPAVYGCLEGATHTTCTSDPGKYTYYISRWCDAWLNGNEQSKSIFRNGGEMANDGNWNDFRSKGF